MAIPMRQRARDLCTCGHQRAAHQKGKSPKVDTGYSRIFNTSCALCYCERFKRDTHRFFKGDLSPCERCNPLTKPPIRPLK